MWNSSIFLPIHFCFNFQFDYLFIADHRGTCSELQLIQIEKIGFVLQHYFLLLEPLCVVIINVFVHFHQFMLICLYLFGKNYINILLVTLVVWGNSRQVHVLNLILTDLTDFKV